MKRINTKKCNYCDNNKAHLCPDRVAGEHRCWKVSSKYNCEKCDREINQKGLCRSCIREIIYKPKDEYCRNCNEKIDYINSPLILGNEICDNCFTIEKQKETNKKSLTLRKNLKQEPIFELALEYYKSTDNYYQFYDGIFIHQNHDIWQITNRPEKWRDKYKLIVLEKNKKTNNYYECGDKIELLTFIDSYESHNPTSSSEIPNLFSVDFRNPSWQNDFHRRMHQWNSSHNYSYSSDNNYNDATEEISYEDLHAKIEQPPK